MWECKYGKEPLNTRLFVLRLLRKIPVIFTAAILGALCIGGPYFLTKVTFGPAKEYEAVTDFYIDYAVKEDGTQHTYINFATWDQLLKDDVFTDRILLYMAGKNASVNGEELQSAPLSDVEKAAGITKKELCGYLHADVLSDTRIVTTTVTTNDPELTMKIEKALIPAMFDFGEQQREIAELRILQEPAEASLVIADVRTFRACMVGVVTFVFVTVLYLCLYFALDEGIHVPETFERRYGTAMLGTIHSKELRVLAGKLLPAKFVLLTADDAVDLEQVEKALAELRMEVGEGHRLEELLEMQESIPAKDGMTEAEKMPALSAACGAEKISGGQVLLVVKAGAHNGKLIEKTLDFCGKCGITIAAALLWDADEKLIAAYELPEHVFFAWRRQKKDN